MLNPTPATQEIIGGVDTHKNTHYAAVISTTGQHLAAAQFPATTTGYAALIAFITSFGAILRVGVEGTNSYGAALTRRFAQAGIPSLEVLQPGRRRQGARGKSDEIDAYAAAESALAHNRCSQPKSSDGAVEQMRVITIARNSAVSARAEALTQIANVLVTAPEELRERYRSMPAMRRIAAFGRIRGHHHDDEITATTTRVLHILAKRVLTLGVEISAHDSALKALIDTHNPALLQARGVGVVTAAALLISAGDNPQRLGSEAQFAMLAGVAPLPASSGQTTRYRLNRGGNRQANHALHTIAVVRLHTCERTRAYAARRKAEGKTSKEILRCLKRAIAREIYHLLTAPPTVINPEMLKTRRIQSGLTLNETSLALGCSIAKLSYAERGISTDRDFLATYQHHLDQLDGHQTVS